MLYLFSNSAKAWLQKPGVIKIEHKNRVQMLAKASRSARVSIEKRW